LCSVFVCTYLWYRIVRRGHGKATIAANLPNKSKIFDNHLLIDPVAAIFDRDMPGYQPLQEIFRRECLSAISQSSLAGQKDVTWILTDSRSSGPSRTSSALDYQKAAFRAGLPFFSVILHCGLEENLQRVTGLNRGGPQNTKLTDTAVVCGIREKEDLFHFGGENESELDVTYRSPGEAAGLIFKHILRAESG
jgi:hypothetical protein